MGIEEQAKKGVLEAINEQSFWDRITAIFKGGHSELTEVRTAIAGKDSEITKLKADLAAANTRAETAEKAFETAKNEHAKAIEAKEKEVETRANVIAGEKISKAGHRPIIEVPENPGNAGTAELDQVRKEMATETDPEKRAKLAIKARELRGHKDLFTDPNTRN